jgi:hypothetical protein
MTLDEFRQLAESKPEEAKQFLRKEFFALKSDSRNAEMMAGIGDNSTQPAFKLMGHVSFLRSCLAILSEGNPN